MSRALTDIRDGAAGLTARDRRHEELLLALDAALDKIDALSPVIECMAEPEQLATLREHTEPEQKVREAAQRARSHGAAALERFIREREEAKRKQPWIPPQPRRVRDGVLPSDVHVVQIDEKTGRVWGQTREGG